MTSRASIGSSGATLAVGMPVYNGARWLERSIDSILAQTFTDFELFIADNASTDDTEALCRSYAERDSRVRYHRHPENRGIFRNHNDVYELTSSRYFKWASCSDLCEPTFFERCLDVLEAREDLVLAYPQSVLFSSITGRASLFYQNLTLEDDSPAERIRMVFDWILLNNAFHGIYRRNVLDRVMPCREARGFDINLIAELSLHGKFLEVCEPLFHRRYEPESTGELLSPAEQVAFYGVGDPDFGWRQRAARQLDKFAMPFRAPIPLREKLRVEIELLSRLMWLGPALGRKILARVIR